MANDPASPHNTPKVESGLEGPHERISWSSSQYAENGANPLPELAVDSVAGAEPVSNIQELKAQDDANLFAGVPVIRPPGLIQPDGGDPRSPAVVFNEPEQSWMAKHKTWIFTGLILVVTVLIATVVGVVVKGHKSAEGAGST